MKKRTRWILIAVGVITIALVAFWVFNAINGPVASVRTADVVEGELQKVVSASGEAAARSDIDVYSPIQSTVKRVIVQDQQRVAIGAPLVELDAQPYEISRAQAAAGVAQAQSSEHQVTKSQPTGADYSAARAGVDSAYLAYWIARRNYLHPAPTVVGTTTIPPNPAQLKLQMKEAFAGYRQALAQLKKLDVAADTGPEVNAAQANETQAQLAFDKAVKDLQSSIVRAPIAGRVFLDNFSGTQLQGPARKLTKNQAVSPAAPVLRIVDDRRMKFNADVDEADIAGVKTGQAARVTLDAFSGKEFKGVVDVISILSKTTQSGGSAFTVQIMLPVGTPGLKVGMSGTADITVAKRPKAIQVPVEAVVQRNGKDVVFVVEGGVARMKEVALGLATDTAYEIKSGVSAGQKVITSGLEGLKDGQRVQVGQ